MGDKGKASESNRTKNLRAIAVLMFPDILGNGDAAFKQLIGKVKELCGASPDRRTVERYFNGGSVNDSTSSRVFAAIVRASGGSISDDLRHSIDGDPAEFEQALNTLRSKREVQRSQVTYQAVADALSGWGAVSSGWFNGGRPRYGDYAGVHHLYSLKSVGDAVERQILTITTGERGARARLSRLGQGNHNKMDYEGIVVENTNFLMIVLQKEERGEQFAGCYILVQRAAFDTPFETGIVCKEALGTPCAYRVVMKPGQEGDKPAEFDSTTDIYKALKPALTIGSDGQPAYLEAEIRDIHPKIGPF